MSEIRYRTEAFSGSEVRDAASVMSYETFELGNTDILYTLESTLLKNNHELRERTFNFIDELNNIGHAEEMTFEKGLEFYREILREIKEVTGIEIKYALWLANKEDVIDREWYGRDMLDDEDFESYEIGPIILSDLGCDGTLYGYTECPKSLERQLEEQEEILLNIINERESDNIPEKRALELDEQYFDIDLKIQELKEKVAQKNDVKLKGKKI